MNLEELIEAHLDGRPAEVPDELRPEFEQAVAAHAALQYALGETIAYQEPAPADRPPPELPEDYEVVRELGHGGMGVVYLVRQRSLGRMVAVKVLRPGEAAFGRLVQRFLEEARHLARLRHPNIVSVHEVGHAGDEPYFTMDYVEGEPLSAILARGRLSPSRALAILKQAAEGVQHAHAQGIIHRDLKPGNILVDPQGRAYVSDFGLARDMTQTSKLTGSGEVMGTPAYMAPEQALGEADRIGEVTDVHALGVILYEMLTGVSPYGCDAPANVMVRLLREEPVPPRRIDRRIPRDLETICLKAMAKHPERRYATVRAFLEDLRRFEAGEPVQARRPGVLYHAGRFGRRYAKVVAPVLVTAAVLLAVAPRLFDKTVDQLVAVADEQRDAGEYQSAIRVYRRALQKAPADRKPEILQSMLRCCEETRDDKSAVEACLLVLDSDPDVSFGKYDYLVAQAVVTRLRMKAPNQSIRAATDQDQPLLRLTEKRLQIFLSGPRGTEAERKEASETLAVVQQTLAKAPWPSYTSPDRRGELPEGTPEELLRQAADPKRTLWERGKAADAAGQALEKVGKEEEALAAYRQAFDDLRRVYPAYSGMTWMMPDANHRANFEATDTPECRLVKGMFERLRRLDPSTPNALAGGIRFRLEGVTLPPDLMLSVEVDLYDPEIKDVQRQVKGLSLCRIVPLLQTDQTAWVGVADGRYRVEVEKRSWSYKTEASRRVGTLLLLDPPDPPEVEVRGNVVDVPIHGRLAEEIRLLEPAPGAPVDLRRDFFRWAEVKGAASYLVQFAYKEDSPQGNVFHGLPGPRTSATRVCVGTLTAKDLQGAPTAGLFAGLTAGRTGMWSVQAFDAAGRKIGTTVEDNRPFFVAHGAGEQ